MWKALGFNPTATIRREEIKENVLVIFWLSTWKVGQANKVSETCRERENQIWKKKKTDAVLLALHIWEFNQHEPKWETPFLHSIGHSSVWLWDSGYCVLGRKRNENRVIYHTGWQAWNTRSYRCYVTPANVDLTSHGTPTSPDPTQSQTLKYFLLFIPAPLVSLQLWRKEPVWRKETTPYGMR